MTRRIVILGTGGNCLDILDAIRDCNAAADRPVYDCIGFLDDDQELWGQQVAGVPVLGGLAAAPTLEDCLLVNGIGSERNFWRKPAIIARTGVPDDRFETIIHPSAVISPQALLGPGVVILPQVTVAANARLGRHVMVLPNTVISHDDEIGDYTCIAGGVCVSGQVKVGQCCYLGSHAAIINGITIGERALVGIGSVVLHDVPGNTVVVGNPARFLRPTVEAGT
ncbi:MAG TPA: acetyltransferase [Anaerolineaceae bacterium]|jgi:sugar O-acyltransferase (sialic acid O-acetyltransferase NeuD family)|nr:acetyltransferase [Anaerolineaceae bacterium]